MKAQLSLLLLVRLGGSAALLLAGARARATLGEWRDSVARDRAALAARAVAASDRGGYSVEEVESGSARIREYLSPAGRVFAIAWEGLTHPDLGPLLGSYAAEYEEALRRTPRAPGRRRLEVRARRAVVEKWGHMRHLQGRAYDPALLPPGVSLDEIR